VTWSGQDDLAGIRSYEVEVKEAGGSWTEWLTQTTATQGTFIGTIGMTYTFRLKATDNVDNTAPAWVESDEVGVYSVKKYYAFGGSKVALRQGDVVYYLSGDHLGSTSLTTDDTGTPISEVRYLPYGEERWASGASPTDFTFTGQRNEAGFGLMDYNARYYSARLGRFVSPDTIVPRLGNSQSLNRYSYVLNRPLQGGDPTGHDGPIEQLWDKVVIKSQKLADNVLRFPEGGRGSGGSWVDTDWAGRVILERYLVGEEDWVIDNDPDWSEYMKGNDTLRSDMQANAIDTAQTLQRSNQNNLAIDQSFSQAIENGESNVGYQYLHGTNANVGDFQIQGSAAINPVNTGYRVDLDLTYTWNDVIDYNPQYSTDIFKNNIAGIISYGMADPYSIHITWDEKSSVYLDQNGDFDRVEGDWLGTP
jgi:RHS repeat-associated protein